MMNKDQKHKEENRGKKHTNLQKLREDRRDLECDDITYTKRQKETKIASIDKKISREKEAIRIAKEILGDG